jgi:hypothetical protein
VERKSKRNGLKRGLKILRTQKLHLEKHMEHSPLEELTAPQLAKKLVAFYGTRRFNTVFV